MTVRQLTNRALAIIVAAIGIDQLTKQWALAQLGHGERVPLLSGVRLQLAFNPGVAFGWGAEMGPVLGGAILLLLVALTAWLTIKIQRRASTRSIMLLALVIGGGWGNVVDRVLRADAGPLSGKVVDFIAVDGFAIFNVSDIITVCSIIAWGIVMLSARSEPAPEPTRP